MVLRQDSDRIMEWQKLRSGLRSQPMVIVAVARSPWALRQPRASMPFDQHPVWVYLFPRSLEMIGETTREMYWSPLPSHCPLVLNKRNNQIFFVQFSLEN